MQNYIIIELDTTPPLFDIYMPQYTTRDIENEIKIVANEKISSHEIYVIDSKGKRFEFTFLQSRDNELVGYVTFNQLSPGIATLNVQVKDQVDNVSGIYRKTIEIKDEFDRNRIIDIADSTVNLEISDDIKSLKVQDSDYLKE
ncbi:hypothetical protein V1503_18785 [Bacillus sp. SCS-151]|uniref:hypothetical protein n=1 Tax=Nanhaiella sioensis TaxID=3115293 RepID=UPI00397A3593